MPKDFFKVIFLQEKKIFFFGFFFSVKFMDSTIDSCANQRSGRPQKSSIYYILQSLNPPSGLYFNNHLHILIEHLRTLDSGDRRLQTPPTLKTPYKFESALISPRDRFLKKTIAYPIRGNGHKMNQKWIRSGRVQGPVFSNPKWSYEGDSHPKGLQKAVLDHI